jgi:serine/threonine-protein kinase
MTRNPFVDAVIKSGLLAPDDLVSVLGQYDPAQVAKAEPIQIATVLVRKKLLTKFQAMQLLSGKTAGFLLGKYKILEGIRQDRVGMVFLAEDTSSKQTVSLKVLPSDRTGDPTILQAFLKEVQAAARVNHPSAARVLDLDVHQGTHFVVCEYVPGPTLDKVVAESGPLQPNLAAQYAAQAAVALKFAHAQGLYHRDVKPGNLAITPNGGLKLLDLGLTHMLENPWQRVTKRINMQEYADEIDHVAPEQAWGNEPDAKSDIYSLGSSLYWLLTGQSPFPGTASEKMTARQLTGVPKPSLVNPAVPRELDVIVQKMGAKNPHERFQTANQVILALHPWLPLSQWVSLGINLEALQPKEAERPAEPEPKAANPGGWLSGGLAAISRWLGSGRK